MSESTDRCLHSLSEENVYLLVRIEQLEQVIGQLTHEFIRPLLGDQYKAGRIDIHQWNSLVARLTELVPDPDEKEETNELDGSSTTHG